MPSLRFSIAFFVVLTSVELIPLANAQFGQDGPKLVGAATIGQSQQAAVAISADGATALVGAPFDNSTTGAVWVWTRSGAAWTQQAKLVASGEIGPAQVGSSVALSSDGNTALVGAPGDNNTLGAVWVWTRSAGVWSQQAKLTANDATTQAEQGYSVALSSDGNTAIVGGFFDNDRTGAAWIWTRTGATWTQSGAKMVGTGFAGSPMQGCSVSISGDGATALVGGCNDSSATPFQIGPGAIWVWVNNNGVWTQQGSKLVGAGAVGPSQQGYSLSLSSDGNTAIEGGPSDNNSAGATWVFTRSAGSWTQQGAKLNDPPNGNRFGNSVALSSDGNTAIVGAPGSDDLLVWTRSSGLWTKQMRLKGQGEAGNFLGSQGNYVAISADGTTVIEGAPGDNNGVGAAWVFVNGFPAITANPLNQNAGAGLTATFTATATGNPTPTVQWQVSTDSGSSFANIPGATNPAYAFTVAPSQNGNQYRAVFTNNLGSFASNAATLTIQAPFLSLNKTHNGNFIKGQQNALFYVTVSNGNLAGPSTGLITVADNLPPGLTLVSMSGSGWTCPGTAPNNCTRTDSLNPAQSFPPILVTVNVTANAVSPLMNTAMLTGGSSADYSATDTVNIIGGTGLGFFPVMACRAADTRPGQGKSGALGPPALSAYVSRDYPLPSSTCGIPGTAEAYSLNFTAAPPGPLDFLATWPTGQSYTGASTLNSPDGSIIANAALVPAGTNGSITVAAGQPSDLIIDANGYFAPANGQDLAFYPITPCRVADTRASQGKSGAYGPPSLAAYANRDFPISGTCGIPNAALAYSLNMTVVPQGRLDFLSTWPTGTSYPGVSTLNSVDGNVIANAAIVTAGLTGSITTVASNPTDLIIDANGYFAVPGSLGALRFYPVAPCRVADTRNGQGKTGSFGPPSLVAYQGRDFPVQSAGCSIPSNAQAYSLNLTAVPQGPLDFLSVWPTGQPYPNVSTLNSPKGTAIANAAIVPVGTNGSITVVTGKPADLIIDINGYFAP